MPLRRAGTSSAGTTTLLPYTGAVLISIDPKTGCAASVAVARSTGVKALDDSAVAALRKWCWKPGKWKEVDVPVTFTMGRKRPMQLRAVRLPSWW